MPDGYKITPLPTDTAAYRKKFQPFYEQACIEANPNNLSLLELDCSIMDIINRAKELMKAHEKKEIQELKQREKQEEENDDENLPF